MIVEIPPRLVSLKFSMNEDLIPSELKKLQREEFREVKFFRGATGIPIVEKDKPVPMCSLAQLVRGFDTSRRDFVGAAYERRPDPSGKKIYHTACYFFALHEFAAPSKDFEKVRYALRQELDLLCTDAWTIRSFWDNPFYDEDGHEVEGQRALEICLNGRQPLVDDKGLPLLVWQDRSKKDVKIPMRPKHFLLTSNGNVSIYNE